MLTSPALRTKAAGKPRVVANLAFSEIIIVWALRHSFAAGAPGNGAGIEKRA